MKRLRRIDGKVLNTLGDLTSPDWPSAPFWKYDRLSLSEFLSAQGLSEEAIHLRRAAFGQWDDTVDRVSALRALGTLALERPGAAYYKIRGGNDRLPHAFALRLAARIRYGSPVVRIERTNSAAKEINESV